MRINRAATSRPFQSSFVIGNTLLAFTAGISLADPLSLAWPMEVIRLLIAATFLHGLKPLPEQAAQNESVLQPHDHLLTNMHDVYYRLDANGKFEIISPACQKTFGYVPEEMLGRRAAEFYADSTKDGELFAILESNGDTFDGYLLPMRHKDGHTVTMEFNSKVRRNASGKAIGAEGVGRDVSKRLQTEQQITTLGRIVEAASNEIYVLDVKTEKFTIVNRGARENLGYSMDELAQMSPEDLRAEKGNEQRQRVLAHKFQSLINNEVSAVIYESALRRKDGSEFPVEISLQLVNSEQGQLFFAITQDITQRQRDEAKLRQAQRLNALGQLTGGVAHDFNNMLQAMQLNLERIKPVDAEQNQWLTGVHHVLAKAGELTQRLLAFASHQVLQPRLTDVNLALMELKTLFELTLSEANQLEFDLATDVPRLLIEVDAAQFENALLNLVLNARDAMLPGGTLAISSRLVNFKALEDVGQPTVDAGEYVEIEVSDTGAGMTDDIKAVAIDPFFTTKPPGEGTGLGLSMVYGFVKQSDGHMTIDSKVSCGTNVRMYFPLSRDKLVGTTDAGLPTGSNGKETVLLIEDDAVIRELLADALEEMGYRLLVAEDGATAQQQVTAHAGTINLVISDVLLSGGDSGPEVVDRIKAQQGPLKTIFISGHTRQYWSDGQTFPEDCAFLQKPFNSELLASTIQQQLQA